MHAARDVASWAARLFCTDVLGRRAAGALIEVAVRAPAPRSLTLATVRGGGLPW